jgi:predicted RND superfamily exporter protein
MKLFVDELRQNTIIPEFGNSPIGSGDSVLGKTLSAGVLISRYIPIIFTVFIVILSLFVANYAIGVGAGFSQEDFLPSEQQSGIANAFPEPFAPSEYESPKTLNLIDEKFEQDSNGGTVTVYIESPLRKGYTLEMIDSASQSPPDSFITNGRRAEQRSILTLIEQYSQQDKEFRRLVERNDNNGNGVPDENLQTIYDELFSSQFGDQARSLITEDYRSTRIIYSVESSADNQEVTEDAQLVADRFTMSATATGSTVVFQDVGDLILQTAISSLIVAMSLSAVFLVLIYWYTERRPLLGLVNLVPVILTIVFVVATMRYLGVTFNALTATILSIGIGLGVDYSAHIVHRFSDEYDSNGLQDSIQTTIIGTGGALTGSMMTTASGIGVLVLAITPLLGQFGLIIATTIIYAYMFSIVMLPSVLVIWAKIDSFIRS